MRPQLPRQLPIQSRQGREAIVVGHVDAEGPDGDEALGERRGPGQRELPLAASVGFLRPNQEEMR